MKVFFVRVQDSDFIKEDGVWTSPVIDLYDNDTYKNYTHVKAGYGLNLLGNGTWTGMEENSDEGFIDGDRFVDTSGRIDIISYTLETDPSVDGLVTFGLDVYMTDDVSATPTWVNPVQDLDPTNNIDLIDAFRYVYFRLYNVNTPNIAFSADMLVRIEIDQPVIAPLYRRTKQVLDKLPEWMAMRELDNVPATPSLGVPTTVGGTLVNAAAGEWLEELANDLTILDLQKWINTADLNQLAWVYRKDNVPQFVWEVVGDGTVLSRAFDLEEFYEALEDEPIFYWDEVAQTIYTRQDYTWLVINQEEAATPSGLFPHHVWNWFDDIGLLVDLKRNHLEDNATFRLRILDVHINKPGVGAESFKRALRRELNIWSVYGSTPNSDYLGATPIVLEMSDIEQDSIYITPEGLPTERFTKLVANLAIDYPTTWGYFYWDQAFWDIGGPEHEGYNVLPNRFDATPLPDQHTQSGVGFGNDLFVYRPDAVTGPHQFEATLKVRGRQRSDIEQHTDVEFMVNVWGRADKEVWDNPEISVWLTIDLYTLEGKHFIYSFEATATSDADADNPTGTIESAVYYDIFEEDGISYLDWKEFGTELTPDQFATPVVISIDTVDEIYLTEGRWDWDLATPALTDFTSDQYEAWFSDDDAEVLHTSGTPTQIFSPIGPVIVFRSLETSTAPGYWESEKISYWINLNGVLPDQTEEDFVLTLPPIVWDPALDATPTREYIIEIITYSEDATPEPGAYALDANGDRFFIDTSYIELDGSTAWADGIQTVPDGTTEVTFSTLDGAEYPIQDGSLWTLFEYEQLVPFEGMVDENGPWRNNVVPSPGNTNYNWKVAELARSDFGIPDDVDYVPTWIGVDSSDPQVIVWLENNTIVPVVEAESAINYPANAIEEFEDGGVYGFESFMVKARLKPDPAPPWNPQVNSGWFYEQQQEYYLYAGRSEAVVSGASSVILQGVSHQGAPIIVWTDEATPRLLRQVAFHDATPTLTLTHTETLPGNGTDTLYLAYPDVYGITVTEHYSEDAIGADSSVTSNAVQLAVTTEKEKLYDVTYTVNNSFYAEMNYDDNGVKKTRLVFDQSGDYVVNFETSILNPATPVDLPLSPLYSSLPEGFIYISHDEYPLDDIQVFMSPSRITANGTDYMQITIRSVDNYGNPKGNQSFTLSTDFGTLDDTSIVTDRDGFASAILTAGSSPPGDLTGTLTITGAVSDSVDFDVEAVLPETGRLMAIVSPEQIPADFESKVNIFGKVEDSEYQPVAGTQVFYRRGRSLFELFQKAFEGSVVTSSDGTFEVGPYTAATPTDPGYWFASLETNPATPSHHVGDVVFWFEYPMTSYGIDDLSGLPTPANQMATPISEIPPYAVTYQFPFTYDESATPHTSYPAITPVWLPPKWYSLPWYLQYQLGLFGNIPNQLDNNYIDNAHSPREDL